MLRRFVTPTRQSCQYFCSVPSNNNPNLFQKFWKWTTQARPSWKEDKTEAAVLFCVFGVTGSSSVAFVRPALKNIGIDGTMIDGPWSYRIASVLIISPIYACILVTIGTLSGRHIFFANMGRKILSRFMPKSAASKIGCPSSTKNPTIPK
jgi:hypothetical protein